MFRSEKLMKYRKTILFCVIVILLFSVLDIAGWLFEIPHFKSIVPGWQAMQLVTAICLILTIAALVLTRSDSGSTISKILPLALVIPVLLISLLTILEYEYSSGTGNGLPLQRYPLMYLIVSKSYRMAEMTAFNFLFTGIVIILFSFNRPLSTSLAHIFILPVIFVTYYVLVCYFFNYTAAEFRNIPVGLNTALSFSGICGIVLFLEPDSWLTKRFVSGDFGGLITRKLLPPVMILPVIIGWIRLRG
jgi:hypothetical protein